MPSPQPPEGGSFPRRPRQAPPVEPEPAQAPAQEPVETNGTDVAASGAYAHSSRQMQRYLLASEEFRAAYRHLVEVEPNLPPALPPWDGTAPVPASSDPITQDIRAGQLDTESFLLDVQAAGRGPSPTAVPELDAPADPDAFLVGGFIRPGTTVMLTGPPGSSKSWAARQLAMAAAAGLEAFLDTYALDRSLNVLLIDEDNGPDEEWRRDETLLTHLGLARHQLGRLRRLSLAGIALDKPEWQHWLRGQIRINAIDLVILDPISEMHGGKELRDDPGFRSMLGFLKRLKVDFPRLASLLVHHTRKVMPGDRTSERGLDDVRGQWGQTPDVVALMWPLAERRVAWELHKRVPHSRLILEATASGPLVKVADETTSRSRRMETDDKVLAAIESGATQADEIAHATGLSRPGVYKALKRLGEVGLVTARKPYQLIEDREIQGVEGDR